MNMVVCIKQVIDPEAPPASFKVDSSNNKMTAPPGVSQVVDPYAEYAVEAALRIKDAQGGKITAVSLGVNLQRDVVKKPLSMGADQLVLLEDEAFTEGDSWATAYALAMAIKKLGEYDLILCGRQASDWDAGQVGLGIAEALGLPSVTLARKIEVDGVAHESNGPVGRSEVLQAQNLRDVLQALYEGIPEHRILVIKDELPPEGVPVNDETDAGEQEKDEQLAKSDGKGHVPGYHDGWILPSTRPLPMSPSQAT